MSLESFFLIVLAILLILANGFFVAAEFALVEIRKTQIEALSETWCGRLLKKVHGKLDAYLSACQVGITLASLALGMVGEPAFSHLVDPVLNIFDFLNAKTKEWITIGFSFMVISYLHIVIGEMLPKSIAIRKAELISLWVAPGMFLFYNVFYPLIWLLNGSTVYMLKFCGMQDLGHDSTYTTDEIKMIMNSNEERGNFSQEEWRSIAHLIDFSELTVSEIMQPIGEVSSLSAANSFEQNMQIIEQTRYSRYPFFTEDGEKLLGIINLKDIFLSRHEKTEDNDFFINKIKQVEIIHPDIAAISLFRQMRKGMAHLALIGYPGMKPIGFITLKSLLGVMVGHLRDENRHNNQDWTRLKDGTYIGKGSLPLVSLERLLGIKIDHEHADSIGGLIMETIAAIPSEGQRFSFDGFSVVVKKMQGPKIMLVRVYPKNIA